ncbi:TPA: hypothetical protein DIU27_03780 [Candidatus Collierbacteria bacterium]|uniref:Uncharacterized protein n=1 Tax=Candidatus Collierbacteria bacterium GW2011_GWB2_44_22 TaxID=1618387 RepID=A0A0G1HZB5_9BACT|nr:MAG: hypothetical protein UW31_C0007G0079 [Candidatus Collierbacteria bacterium GW2011_GWA2_44_13]KKT50475.1 MAG: hypothetical protein UW42_C0018G0015 [Candidatus Collierbacteria bacterium GW2011_GWB1_44_197]KKT52310.1 MAG: hypothetical protein UW44_C0003G0153 [Candidatus Collierbacteria bacterium GW2011_GWB2_44_22]KKT63230.1 MAG: hypothetical protein UW56_C0001G0067 [Candidatus Collierbacteria bacterium GW2011_GWD1_44_27]KKT65731.1 MAG: hypothetical protein UW58_C0021G0009 [Candidatus Colli
MSIIFYDHLVVKSEIEQLLAEIDEAENQKGKTIQLIDDIIFQGILSFVLEKLEPHHHHVFLTIVHERPYDPEIISYLKLHVGSDIEEEIRSEADHLVKMILSDLHSED